MPQKHKLKSCKLLTHEGAGVQVSQQRALGILQQQLLAQSETHCQLHIICQLAGCEQGLILCSRRAELEQQLATALRQQGPCRGRWLSLPAAL